MKQFTYLACIAILLLQYSCKKEPHIQDDFDKYDNYCTFSIDTANYMFDKQYSSTVASSWISDAINHNDSISILVGSKLTDKWDNPLTNLLQFYNTSRLATNDFEIQPVSPYDPYYPSVGDLMKFFPVNKELKFSQYDLPWLGNHHKSEKGVVFTWGLSSEYTTSQYEIISHPNKSSCMVVRSKINDLLSIKVEINFDIYVRNNDSDQIIHIKNGKLITLIKTD